MIIGKILVKILKKGDKVLQVDWNSPENLRIVVQRKSGEVDLYSIGIDEVGIPRIEPRSKLTITYGEDEVEITNLSQTIPSQKNGGNEVKMSTF